MIIRNFGLYIHWPFCVSKCPYCDFNSHVRARIDDDLWTNSYLKELEYWGQKTAGRTLSSVFFGGGTPSLMNPQTVRAILNRLSDYWFLSADLEITLEANPNSAEQAKFNAFRDAGVNRLSLGIQSLREDALRFLGRAHGRSEALRAINMAKQTFDRYSFDLIYARPDQTLDQWQEELTEALDFAGGHLSLYQLTLEKGTAFYTQAQSGRLHLPEEQLAGDFYELTQEVTEKAGLPAYEISNHARLGQESRHNLIYWQGQEYGALGPGAHGRLHNTSNFNSNTQIQRWATKNFRTPERWLEAVAAYGHGLEEQLQIPLDEHLTEFLMMGLRLREGVAIADIEALAQCSLTQRFSQLKIDNLISENLISVQSGRLCATSKGLMCLNALLRYLLT